MKIQQIAVWCLCLLSCANIWSMDQNGGANAASSSQQPQRLVMVDLDQILNAVNNHRDQVLNVANNDHNQVLNAINNSHRANMTSVDGLERAANGLIHRYQQEIEAQANAHRQAMENLRNEHSTQMENLRANHYGQMTVQNRIARNKGLVFGAGFGMLIGAVIYYIAQYQVQPGPARQTRTIARVVYSWGCANKFSASLLALGLVTGAAGVVYNMTRGITRMPNEQRAVEQV